MKTYFLYYFKKVAVLLVLIALGFYSVANIDDFCNGYYQGYHQLNEKVDKYDRLTPDKEKMYSLLSLVFSFSGFLLYVFSKEKFEDEFIQRLRYMSLAKSLLITWIFVIILQLINGDIKLEGLSILQFQLIVYVIIYNFYKKLKFA